MHACDLIQLATTVAAHGRTFAEGAQQVSQSALEDYWTASRSRLDRWARTLKNFTHSVHYSRGRAIDEWPQVRPVIEEILLSEILSRVWSSLLFLHDQRRGVTESYPIARSVMMGHMEARHRALTLMLHGPGVGTVAAVELNRLRMRVERWIDFLVGNLLESESLVELAIDPDRATEFAADARGDRRRSQGWQLALSSLSLAFRSLRSGNTMNGDLNLRIGQAIIATLPTELFDATGILRSLWVVRLTNATSDAEGMLDELTRMDQVPAGHSGRRF